jgi:hypothetical protein
MALNDMWGNQPCMTYKTDNFIWFSLIAFPDSQHHYSKSRQLLAQSAAFLWMLSAGKHLGTVAEQRLFLFVIFPFQQ